MAAPPHAANGVSQVQMTLIYDAEAIYSPEVLEHRNLLLAGGSIVGILSDADARALRVLPLKLDSLDAKGCIITPGFVDLHVHVAGGGGEAGFASRAPEAKVSELLSAGITTVVGITGTDSVTRSQENLVAKCRALREEGISAYHWAGAYRLPVPTLTGDIQKDVAMLDTCVGVGELAVADHRGSNPSWQEIARIASDARVGGMLGGKAGLLHLHMGAGSAPFASLQSAVAGSDVPITQLLPTHCERNEETQQGAVEWLRRGGCIDMTAGKQARDALATLEFRSKIFGLAAQSRVSISSDSYGSYPEFSASGALLKYRVVKPIKLLAFVRDLHLVAPTDNVLRPWPLEAVLPLVTLNPAERLVLARKGRIALGADADLLLFRPRDLALRYVYSRGVLVKTPDWVRGSTYEEGPGIVPHKLAE